MQICLWCPRLNSCMLLKYIERAIWLTFLERVLYLSQASFSHLIGTLPEEITWPAVGEEGIKTWPELGSSGKVNLVSEVSLAVCSPENCKLWNLGTFSTGVPCDVGVGSILPSSEVIENCCLVTTWVSSSLWPTWSTPLDMWLSVGVEWCCGGTWRIPELSEDKSDGPCTCSLSTSSSANMSFCEEQVSDSFPSFIRKTADPATAPQHLCSLLPALLELVSLVDWVRRMEWSGRCLRIAGDNWTLALLDRLLKSPW